VKAKEGHMLIEQEIGDFCKGKIAYFKTSRQVMFVNDFPMNVAGRIQKFRMREDSIRILGLQEEDKIETAGSKEKMKFPFFMKTGTIS
jgi:fatty-acyl-CoA synthase